MKVIQGMNNILESSRLLEIPCSRGRSKVTWLNNMKTKCELNLRAQLRNVNLNTPDRGPDSSVDFRPDEPRLFEEGVCHPRFGGVAGG